MAAGGAGRRGEDARAGCRSGALSVRARHTPPGCRTRVRGGGCVYLVEPAWVAQRRPLCHAVEVRGAWCGLPTDIIRTSFGHHTDIIRTKKADTYGQGSDKEAGIIRTSYGHHTDIIRTSYGQGTGHNRTRSNHPPLQTEAKMEVTTSEYSNWPY